MPGPATSGVVQSGADSGRSGQAKRLTTSYTNRLRVIGRYLDQQGLRRVTIVDGGTAVKELFA